MNTKDSICTSCLYYDSCDDPGMLCEYYIDDKLDLDISINEIKYAELIQENYKYYNSNI